MNETLKFVTPKEAGKSCGGKRKRKEVPTEISSVASRKNQLRVWRVSELSQYKTVRTFTLALNASC